MTSDIHSENDARELDKTRKSDRPLKVVIVDEELPYPPTSGKRIRTWNLLSRLADHHQITYMCHRNAEPGEAQTASAYFREKGIATVVVDRPVPAKSGIGFYGRLGANLFSKFPYSVASHNSSVLRQAVRDFAARNTVDLWQCEWTPYFEVLRGLTGQRRLIMAHNIESQIWERYRQTETNPLKRWYIHHQWKKFERFERRVFAEATMAIFVSDPDAALAQRQFGAPRVAVVENGVDTAYFRPSDGPRNHRRVLFLGSLDWRPNLDAVQLLMQDIMPKVRKAEPLAELCIVGRNPPEWLVRQAAQDPGIELAANVPDVRPYLHGCGVLAVPLRIGGGSRLKILEALATGLPVVSSTIGAEGLRLEGGGHFVVADGIDDTAKAIVQSIRAPERAMALAHRGRDIVLQEYDWQPLAEKLDRIWHAWRLAPKRAERVLSDSR